MAGVDALRLADPYSAPQTASASADNNVSTNLVSTSRSRSRLACGGRALVYDDALTVLASYTTLLDCTPVCRP